MPQDPNLAGDSLCFNLGAFGGITFCQNLHLRQIKDVQFCFIMHSTQSTDKSGRLLFSQCLYYTFEKPPSNFHHLPPPWRLSFALDINKRLSLGTLPQDAAVFLHCQQLARQGYPAGIPSASTPVQTCHSMGCSTSRLHIRTACMT